MRTPMRDELGLNDMDSMVVGGGRRAEAQRQAQMRSELRVGLGSLPAPQNEYQIMAPDMPDDEGEGGAGVEEDAADIKARKLREEEGRRQAQERKKSKVRVVRCSCSEHVVQVCCVLLGRPQVHNRARG